MANKYGVKAAEEYLLVGNRVTRLEAMVLFAVPDLTKIISDLRRGGYVIARQSVPLVSVLERVNLAARLQPPAALPVHEITLTESWVRP